MGSIYFPCFKNMKSGKKFSASDAMTIHEEAHSH
jgi:hypothetical protein